MTYFLGALLLLGLVLLYYNFNPALVGFFPQCPFWKATGFLCPGCGSQRAIHALLHFDLGTAFHYNPLAVASIPLVALGFTLEKLKKKTASLEKIYNGLTGQPSLYAMVGVIVIFWIARNF